MSLEPTRWLCKGIVTSWYLFVLAIKKNKKNLSRLCKNTPEPWLAISKRGSVTLGCVSNRKHVRTSAHIINSNVLILFPQCIYFVLHQYLHSPQNTITITSVTREILIIFELLFVTIITTIWHNITDILSGAPRTYLDKSMILKLLKTYNYTIYMTQTILFGHNSISWLDWVL